MAHFARIDDDNKVQEIIVISNDDVDDIDNVKGLGAEPAGLDFIQNTLGLPGTWKQCSFNNNFRGTFPVMRDQEDIDAHGDFYTVYNAEHDVFIPPMARLNDNGELELNPDYTDPMEVSGSEEPEVDSEWVNP
jgi:hypothetical protein